MLRTQPGFRLAPTLGSRGLGLWLAACSGAGLAQGPGGAPVVNAPVAPDAIYVGRAGASPTLSVVDLNGFGASTGNPAYDPLNPIVEGNSNYPNNPNLLFQGALLGLAPGTTTVDGGSAGVFTLTKSSALDAALLGAGEISSVADLALGHALDLVFHDGLGGPGGCASGGGSLCSATGLKSAALYAYGPDTVSPLPTPTPLHHTYSGENAISWAPHPNPPPLLSVPLCASPSIEGAEPTSIEFLGMGLSNLLVPGAFPLGIPSLGIPPSGLLATQQNAYFTGPSFPTTVLAACHPYAVRQQVGHFLYVADRARGEIAVLNSNRFTVLERIPLSDPTSLAMSPDLRLLAVSRASADAVSFVGVDPSSPTFHKVVLTTPVGDGPAGLAWQAEGEDLLVCNREGGSVSVISGSTLAVRKVLTSGIQRPIDVAVSARQEGFGSGRGVYYAFVLNGDGSLALFESGPGGVGGLGYDEVVGVAGFTLRGPAAIQPDLRSLEPAVWIAHRGQLGPSGAPTGLDGGALTRVALVTETLGPLPITPAEAATPQLRGMRLGVKGSVGSDQLTGLPVDLAFDDQANLGVLPAFTTSFSPPGQAQVNGKGLVRRLPGSVHRTSSPQFVFAVVPRSSQGGAVIDVLQLDSLTRFDTNPFHDGVQSIPAPDARVVASYFRQ